MTRTRRSVLRGVSAATAAAVATGTVTAQSGGDSTDGVGRSEILTTTQTCHSGETESEASEESIPVSDRIVRFSGSMTTPNPCHEAVIESIERDGETVVVTVGSEWPDDVEMCMSCLGYIEFEGVVEITDPDVEEVVVRTVDPWA